MKKLFLLLLLAYGSSYAQTQIGADINGEAAYDLSGNSVSLSSDGSIIAIGAPRNDGSGTEAGSVRVYQNIAGTWTQIGSDINGEAAGDWSGHSVSLSSDGSIVAIGAPSNDGSGSNAGSVRVYQNISGMWTQIGADINGEAAEDWSGWDVSLSGDGTTLAIGAIKNYGSGTNSGSVRVFKNLSGMWTQIGADIDGEAAYDQCGYSVSLTGDGTVVAIGAANNDGSGNAAGSVRVFKNISGTWTQIGADINGEAAGDQSGTSVSLSSDGTTVAIGAVYNDGSGSNAGHVRIFSICSTTSTDTQTACGSYTWIDGNTYTSSNNTATHTLTNAAGCDSIVTLNLTINSIDLSITNTSPILIANQAGGTYQWINCDNNNTAISGETNASFTATANGNYAVVVTINGCSDTTTCANVSGVGINELANEQIKILPNPSSGLFTVNFGNSNKLVSYTIKSLEGKIIIENKAIVNPTFTFDLSQQATGVYYLVITDEQRVSTQKLIKY